MQAAGLLLASAVLVFAILASIKAARTAREARRGPEPEDLGPLASIFVCITFAWRVEKLGFLQLVRTLLP